MVLCRNENKVTITTSGLIFWKMFLRTLLLPIKGLHIGVVLTFISLFLVSPYGRASTSVHTLFDKLVNELKPIEWSQARQKEKIAELEQARLWRNPEIQLGFGTTNFSQFQGRYEEFSISQVIPLNGRRNGLAEKIRLQKKLSALEQKQLEFEVGREILLRLYFHQMNKELAGHLEERLKRLALIEQFLEKKQFVSPKDQIQREQLKHRLKFLKVEIAEVRTRLLQTTQYFKAYCSPACLNNLSPSWPSKAKLVTLFEVLQKDQKSFEKRLQLQTKLIEEDQEIAHTLWRPDIRLYGMRTYEGQPYQSAQVNQALGVGLALPLFDRGQQQVRIASAKAYDLERTQIEIRRKRFGKTLALKQEFEKSLEVLKQYDKKNQTDGEKILEIASRSFQNGLIPVGQFLDIDEQVHTGASMMVMAQYDLLRLSLDMMAENQSYLDLKETFL